MPALRMPRVEILAKEAYVRPPDVIATLVTAPRHLNISLSTAESDRRHFLKEQSEGLPTVSAFGKPHLYFGGLQVDPAANRARALTSRGATGLSLVDATTVHRRTSKPRKAQRSAVVAWSPDGKQLAYLANFETATHVFVADIATKKSVQVTKTPLLATLVTQVDWTLDGKNLVVVLVRQPRAARPVKPAVAAGPRVQVDRGKPSPQRQFFSLSRRAVRQGADGVVRHGSVGRDRRLDESRTQNRRTRDDPVRDVSPDGQYFRVTSMQKPFSYIVQYSVLPGQRRDWDGTGKVLATIQKRALREAPDTTDGDGGGRAGGEGTASRLACDAVRSGLVLHHVRCTSAR